MIPVDAHSALAKSRSVNMPGNLTLPERHLTADTCITANVKGGPVNAGHVVTAEAETQILDADKTTSLTTETRMLRSPTGKVVVMGHLQVTGTIKYKTSGEATGGSSKSQDKADEAESKDNGSDGGMPSDPYSFLQLAEAVKKQQRGDGDADASSSSRSSSSRSSSISTAGVWRLYSSEDFSDSPTVLVDGEVAAAAGAAAGATAGRMARGGWVSRATAPPADAAVAAAAGLLSGAPVSHCGKGNLFMGGHCKAAGRELRKIYRGLPPHRQLRLVAKYHFIDGWEGEAGFATVAGRYVWTDHHRAPAKGTAAARGGISLCGDDQVPEQRLNVPIDASVPHSANEVEVERRS